VIEVGVEVFALGDINTIRRLVVISGQNVVNVVNATWSQSDLGQINGPNSSIGILGL